MCGIYVIFTHWEGSDRSLPLRFFPLLRGNYRLNEKELTAKHNSPDGNLQGWDVLLAMFVHVAHHRGQAEIYLRDNGIFRHPIGSEVCKHAVAPQGKGTFDQRYGD